METRTFIKSIEQEELENLISNINAMLDGPFAVSYDEDDLGEVKKESCRYIEEVCANLLIDGKPIYITDYSGEGDDYGTLPKEIDEEGNVTYRVTLEDIYNALNDPSAEDIQEHIEDFANGEDDADTAFILVQQILFNEIIYV